ncbi:hypothetical protein D3C73_975430 [compost metagenome]
MRRIEGLHRKGVRDFGDQPLEFNGGHFTPGGVHQLTLLEDVISDDLDVVVRLRPNQDPGPAGQFYDEQPTGFFRWSDVQDGKVRQVAGIAPGPNGIDIGECRSRAHAPGCLAHRGNDLAVMRNQIIECRRPVDWRLPCHGKTGIAEVAGEQLARHSRTWPENIGAWPGEAAIRRLCADIRHTARVIVQLNQTWRM